MGLKTHIAHTITSSVVLHIFLVWDKNFLENCGKDGKSNCSEAWQVKPTRAAASAEGAVGSGGRSANWSGRGPPERHVGAPTWTALLPHGAGKAPHFSRKTRSLEYYL